LSFKFTKKINSLRFAASTDLQLKKGENNLNGIVSSIISPSPVSISPTSSSAAAASASADAINARDQYGATKFYYQCQRGKTSEVSGVLKQFGNEVDVNVVALCLGCSAIFVDDYRFPSKFYRTPLHISCARGYLDIVKMLLDHPNINPNLLANNLSPLEAAIYNGQTHVVEILLRHPKVDINCSTEQGRTALILACKLQNEEAVKMILNHPNLKLTPYECRTLMGYFHGIAGGLQSDLFKIFIAKMNAIGI